jgi:hypothetical protein
MRDSSIIKRDVTLMLGCVLLWACRPAPLLGAESQQVEALKESLRQYTLKAQIAEQQFNIEEEKGKRRLVAKESLAFAYLSAKLISDESTARREKEILKRERAGTIAFAHGADSPAKRQALARLLQKIGHDSLVNHALENRVTGVTLNDFKEQAFEEIVEVGGALREPPQVLTRRGAGRDAYTAFRDQWIAAAKGLKERGEVAGENAEQLQGTLAAWKVATVSLLEEKRLVQRPAAIVYFRRADALVATAFNPRQNKVLIEFLKTGGYPFRGETMGELLLHVLMNDLTLQPGCRAQILLGQLSHEMVRASNSEIAILDECIERCKAQSPAQNMALRQRLVSNSGGTGSAPDGVSLPAYGRQESTIGQPPPPRDPPPSDYQIESKPQPAKREP